MSDNPYLSITPLHPAPQTNPVRCAPNAVPEVDCPWWAAVMAFRRSKPYYIEALAGYTTVRDVVNALHREQRHDLPNTTFYRIRVVWAGGFHTEAEARQRAAELVALPHPWRRRFIDERNPSWLDIVELYDGWPFELGGVVE